jgi:RND family efflux transporter MFP subunit
MMTRETGVEREAPASKPGRRPVVTFLAVLACLVAAGIIAGLLPRLSRQKGLARASQEAAELKPVVLVSAARLASSKEAVELPGDLQSIIESPIFARADGYLKTRRSDVGDRVKTGQLMAEIETPELDQQISQARATLAQAQSSLKVLQADIELARANLNLARATTGRWQRLLAKGVVSRQDSDEKQADFAVKQAQQVRAEASLAMAQDAVHASEANLRRLEEMKVFARVTAPFDGIVTARNVDVGTLINAGNGGASKEMFRVARIQPLRIFVNVPQAYVADMHNGQAAELRVQERPGQVFPARVTNISDSLDANSRAMLVILETPNPGAALYPGMYAQVRFTALHLTPELRVSGDAVLLTKNGPRVATVGPDHQVHFKNITIGQDLGMEVVVASGLTEGELVISNPTDAVHENVVVDVRQK